MFGPINILMKLHEITDLTTIIERDERLILEGIMQQLGSSARKVIASLRGKAKIVALVLALLVPAFGGPAAADVPVETVIMLYNRIQQMSDEEWQEWHNQIVAMTRPDELQREMSLTREQALKIFEATIERKQRAQ